MGIKINPCYYVATPLDLFGKNRSESGFLGTSIGDPSHKCRNPGDHLSARKFSVFGGSSQNSAALL